MLSTVHRRGDQAVVDTERQLVDGVDAEEIPAGLLDQPQALDQHRPRDAAPVGLLDVPCRAEFGMPVRLGTPVHGTHSHPVRLDVIGVAVSAVLVVGDKHLWPDLTHDSHQSSGGLGQVGAPKRTGCVVRRRTHHAAVAPPAGPPKEAVVGDA